eukprot:460103_1
MSPIILLILCFGITPFSRALTLYVSPNGNDSDDSICSKQYPCGSIYWATKIIYVTDKFDDVNELEIIVEGFNFESKYFLNPKGVQISVGTSTTTITFAPNNPTHISHWLNIRGNYSDHVIVSGTQSKLIINNLHVENLEFKGLIGLPHDGQITLNNCSMKNITFSNIFIKTSALAIYNSLFDNINTANYFWSTSVVGSGDYPTYLVLKNNSFNHLHLSFTHFLKIISNNVSIEKCHFNDTYLDESYSILYLDSSYLRETDKYIEQYVEKTVFIDNSTFYNINHGSIISVSGTYKHTVYIDNINISTSQMHTEYSYTDYHGLIMLELNAQVQINNVNFAYLWMDNINDICVRSGYLYGVNATFITVQCDTPYRFIYNSGSLIINNTQITNDITKKGLYQFREYIINKSYNIKLHQDVIISFRFNNYKQDQYDKDQDLPNSIIFNNRGQINVNSLTVYGVALHKKIIYNTGSAFIYDFKLWRPDYYFSYNESIQVRQFMVTAIRHNGFNNDLCQTDDVQWDFYGLTIDNSYISGGGSWVSINISNAGYNSIQNTLISDSFQGIAADNSLTIAIYNCSLFNIGKYYMGDWASFLGYYGKLEHEKPLYFENIQYLIIDNNFFNYFPGNGYIHIINPNKYRKSVIEIKQNLFSNPINILLQFDMLHFDQYIQYKFNLTNKLQFIRDIYGYVDNLVNIEGYTQSMIIGNQFESDFLVSINLHSACLYISNTISFFQTYYRTYNNLSFDQSSYHCISGNTFSGYAIKLRDANVISCVYPELIITDDTQCWQELGSINTDIKHGDDFIATDIDTPLIQIIDNSSIILYNAIISTAFGHNDHEENSNHYPYNPLFIHNDGRIVFLDVIIDEYNHSIDIQFNENCINHCNKLYKGLINNIHQLHLSCMNISNTSDIITLNGLNGTKSVNHTLPIEIELSSSGFIHPGGELNIDYKILDLYGNQINDFEQDPDISIILSSEYFNFQTLIKIEPDINSITNSSIGLYIQNAKIEDSFNKSHLITTNVVNNILLINNLSVQVTQCPSGYGLHIASSQCHECNIGQFSIKPSIVPCLNCNDKSELHGINCIGGNKIEIAHNYWIGFNIGNKYIVSQYCPSNYCNQIHNGLYLDLLESDRLCALNRDSNTPLCGQCKTGFVELYGSVNCGECTDNNYKLWILLVVSAAVLSIFIVFTTGIPVLNTGEYGKYSVANCIKGCRKSFNINDNSKEFLSISLSKPITYYYQSVTFMLLNGGIFVRLSGLAQLFNFQFDFVGENDSSKLSGFCWMKNLNAKWEIILRLTIPIFCFITLVLLLILHAIIGKNMLGRKPYFAKAAIKLLLLTIGTICGVCFKLIACRQISDNYSVHFYYGVNECYDKIWYIGLGILLFFIAVFGGLFIKLYFDHRKNEETKLLERNDYILESLVRSYNIETCWYWEIIILFPRRIIIAMINLLTEDLRWRNTLFVILCSYLALHVHNRPFIMEQVNTLETVCLLCLLCILHLIISMNGYEDIIVIGFINAFLILPLFVLLIQWIRIAGPYNPGRVNNKNRSPSSFLQHHSSDSDGEQQLQTNVMDLDDDEKVSTINMVEYIPNEHAVMNERQIDVQLSMLAKSNDSTRL